MQGLRLGLNDGEEPQLFVNSKLCDFLPQPLSNLISAPVKDRRFYTRLFLQECFPFENLPDCISVDAKRSCNFSVCFALVTKRLNRNLFMYSQHMIDSSFLTSLAVTPPLAIVAHFYV